MPRLNLRDLRRVRKCLGKSQSAFAALVGVSTKAIQSYEQGWRSTPAHVQRMALLLLIMSRRKSEARTSPPCWKLRRCAPETTARCPAYQFREGRLCWLVTGTLCEGKKAESWTAKMAGCGHCAVLERQLQPRAGRPTRRERN